MIREDLKERANGPTQLTYMLPPKTPVAQVLGQFRCVSQYEVELLMKKSPAKSCELDPLPTWLLKKCNEEVLPVITAITVERNINVK